VTPWRAQPGPQLTAIQHDLVEELLYGGAVFGGKSDYLLGDFAQDVPRPYGQHWHGVLFRKNYPQLEDLISRSKEIYPAWFPGVSWSNQTKTWTWPNGATLKMRFMETDDDWMQYWGHAYTWIGWDEIALWSNPTPYQRMKARLRSASAQIPNKRIRASANPGGPGHHWVREHWKIGEYPLGSHRFIADDGSGMTRIFIKARLKDNAIGIANDPGYEQRLEGAGSATFVKAIKDGDWSVIEGAFFSEFAESRHVMQPIELPAQWTRFRAMDWGSSKPFSIGWYAVSDGSLKQFPTGALIKYREWYGMKDGQPNVGLKLTAEQIRTGLKNVPGQKDIPGIVEREKGDKMTYAVIDPSAFQEDGGPSIASRMAPIIWRPADNKRIPGWDQLRGRLVGEEGRPMLYFFSTCIHTIRTLPMLQHDPSKAEDVDTDSEDHAGDETRYACMSRPWISKAASAAHQPKDAWSKVFDSPESKSWRTA
jgi:hypothetical protein